MKIGWKLLAIIRTMALLDGMTSEKIRNSKDFKCEDISISWMPLSWVNDWFKFGGGHYYLGFDYTNGKYIVEWRGNTINGFGKKESMNEEIITVNYDGYTTDIAKTILKSIKNHMNYS